MSSSLYWRPYYNTEEDRDVSSLKRTLGDRLLTGADIPFLQGIVAGNGGGDMARDARRLIQAIEKHDHVELYLRS